MNILPIHQFLSVADAKRASTTLQKLGHHDISRWALAGGLAVEFHLRCTAPSTRPLNDIDFLAPSFDSIPETLAADFLIRHVHPHDPPGKTILQLVDPETALRVDLFRAYGAIMARTLPFAPIQLISAADTLARTARLLLDLRHAIPVAAKHADDYLRLAPLLHTSDLEPAWQDHRKPDHPATFHEADTLVRDLIATHPDLLITPDYSTDASQTCPRCLPVPAFPLADPRMILSLLGYC